MPRTNTVSKNRRPQAKKVRHVQTTKQRQRDLNAGERGHGNNSDLLWFNKDRDRSWDAATWGASFGDDGLTTPEDVIDWDDYVDPRDDDYDYADNCFEDVDPYYDPWDDDYLDRHYGGWYDDMLEDSMYAEPTAAEIEQMRKEEAEMAADMRFYDKLDEIDQAWNEFLYGSTYGDYGYLNPWFWDPIYDAPSLQNVKDEYLDYLYWEYPEEHMVMEPSPTVKPKHRTNRERGRRRQQPKLRYVRTEAQRRREQSVKKLRLRGEYINREQGEGGFDFTNAIRQDVHGAAAGGVVRNPDSKPIKRAEAPCYGYGARPMMPLQGTDHAQRQQALAAHRKSAVRLPEKQARIDTTPVLYGWCGDGQASHLKQERLTRTYSVWS